MVWTPGLGGPDNAAVLTWFGVDLFDLSRSRQCAAADVLLTGSGPRDLISNESAGMNSQLLHWELALNDIKSHLVNGSLRTLVEQQSLNSPKLVEHLRYHDDLTGDKTDVGISHVGKNAILHCNSHESLNNPIVTAWVDFMMKQYQPPADLDKVLVLLPCSARKPYRMSKSHRNFYKQLAILLSTR